MRWKGSKQNVVIYKCTQIYFAIAICMAHNQPTPAAAFASLPFYKSAVPIEFYNKILRPHHAVYFFLFLRLDVHRSVHLRGHISTSRLHFHR